MFLNLGMNHMKYLIFDQMCQTNLLIVYHIRHDKNIYRIEWLQIFSPKNSAIDRIDNSHYRLILKLGKEMQINHHS